MTETKFRVLYFCVVLLFSRIACGQSPSLYIDGRPAQAGTRQHEDGHWSRMSEAEGRQLEREAHRRQLELDRTLARRGQSNSYMTIRGRRIAWPSASWIRFYNESHKTPWQGMSDEKYLRESGGPL